MVVGKRDFLAFGNEVSPFLENSQILTSPLSKIHMAHTSVLNSERRSHFNRA